MTQNIEDFLKINDNGETSDSTLWQAFKATMRGAIIAFERVKRKEKQLKLKQLQEQITFLENKHKIGLFFVLFMYLFIYLDLCCAHLTCV